MDIVSNEPVFTTSLLLSGKQDAGAVRLQLSRWVRDGKVIKLRRGLYLLAKPWRKVEPHPFLISNRLMPGSYVSLQSALAWHGAIPEYVPVVTSVGCGRPGTVANQLGSYNFIKQGMRFGYSRLEVSPSQFAFVAAPEKALLDLVYLTPGADTPEFIAELRLQNRTVFNLQQMQEFAAGGNRPKLRRAAEIIGALLEEERGELL